MKTFVEFSRENKLTDKQSELCFEAWNTACDNKNEQIDKLRKGNEILRKMGEFYASEKNWQTPESQGFRVDDVCLGVKDMIEEIDSRDSCMGGNCARQALKEYAEIMGEE